MKPRVFKGGLSKMWRVEMTTKHFSTWREAFDWAYAHATQHCKEGCRHRCPECRMGLGSHLKCDPQCEVRKDER